MSRTAASYSMTWTRGATVDEEFTYTDEAGEPIDLTGYEARMQVRALAQQFGTTGTPLLSLATNGVDPLMSWDTAADGRLRLRLRPDQHAALNPTNTKKAVYAYSIEIYRTEGSGEEVIPLVKGKLSVRGEITR